MLGGPGRLFAVLLTALLTVISESVSIAKSRRSDSAGSVEQQQKNRNNTFQRPLDYRITLRWAY